MKFTFFRDPFKDELIYELRIDGNELRDTKLHPFDRKLLADIEFGPSRGTPIADKLLGLETIARRIEESL